MADRLFFAHLRVKPKNTAQRFYFCIDDELVYLKCVRACWEFVSGFDVMRALPSII